MEGMEMRRGGGEGEREKEGWVKEVKGPSHIIGK